MKIKRYRIKAKKPTGETVIIKNKSMESISKIRDAMMANNYCDVTISKEPTTEEIFIRSLMETHRCGSQMALKIYKSIAKVMAVKGLKFTRKGELNASGN